MRLVAHKRVSTRAQAEEGGGLDEQDRAMREWAAREGHEIVYMGEEVQSAGDDIDKREDLVRSVSMIRTFKADGLLVHRRDRLYRDTYGAAIVTKMVEKLGGKIYSATTSNSDTPTDALTRGLLDLIAMYDRSMRAIITTAGKKLAVKTEGHRWGGQAPFGYRGAGQRGILAIDEDTAYWVQQIFAKHDEDGASPETLAEWLEGQGVAPPPSARINQSGKWHPNTIRRILRRRAFYLGLAVQGNHPSVVASQPPILGPKAPQLGPMRGGSNAAA